MTDYSFMKSGFDTTVQDDTEFKKNLTSILVCFSENALKTASKYIEHGKRKVITPEDIKRCFMFELFAFSKRPNLKENVEKIKNELYSEEFVEGDELDDDIELVEEEEKFSLSSCNCAMCKYINTIHEKWVNFKPNSRIEIILKKHIDTI